MRSPQLLLVAALVLAVSGCGEDPPAGTISEDDLPGDPEVADVRIGDDQAGQVDCPDVNDAEDMHILAATVRDDEDDVPSVAYELSGDNHQEVSDSVWRIAQPDVAVEQVAAGLEKCITDNPEYYETFAVEGHPEALGYVEDGGTASSTVTRRILVPLDDRVVIVTSRRQGGDEFTIQPEDVLEKAIEVSADAPRA